MSNTNNARTHTAVRRLVESAIMIAIGSVLSLFQFAGPWALGGGITFCSMLPLVLISHRYGCRWGLFTGLAYGLLQMLMGIHNVQYATSALMAVGIILLDYVIAYGVIGLAALFNGVIRNRQVSITAGIILTFALRLLCHFLSGLWIWEVMWPNELGWAAPIWSISYNASYMVPEAIITSVVAVLLYIPLRPYFNGEDIEK